MVAISIVAGTAILLTLFYGAPRAISRLVTLFVMLFICVPLVIYERLMKIIKPVKLHKLPAGQVKRVAVIGAGASGITAAKELMEAGLDVTILEMSGIVGGNWVFKEEDGHASVYRSTFINTSKQVCLSYLYMYVRKLQLMHTNR
jgi:FlaA1/EpsC-like NDP-sugar epimerase